jgi:hypothetical protein
MTISYILLLMAVPLRVDTEKHVPQLMISLYSHMKVQDFLRRIFTFIFLLTPHNAGKKKFQFRFLPVTTTQRAGNKVRNCSTLEDIILDC